jgi:thiamine pyrophosphokinase
MPSLNLTEPFLQPTNSTLIVLNQPLPCLALFSRLWSHCAVRIIADGGANRLFHLLPPEKKKDFIPDLILGDMDSLMDDVYEFYHKVGVPIAKDESQDTTDLQKVLNHSLCTDHVFVVGALGGRFDHSMATFHALHERVDQHIVVCNNDSLATLLPAGKTEILVNVVVFGIHIDGGSYMRFDSIAGGHQSQDHRSQVECGWHFGLWYIGVDKQRVCPS